MSVGMLILASKVTRSGVLQQILRIFWQKKIKYSFGLDINEVQDSGSHNFASDTEISSKLSLI